MVSWLAAVCAAWSVLRNATPHLNINDLGGEFLLLLLLLLLLSVSTSLDAAAARVCSQIQAAAVAAVQSASKWSVARRFSGRIPKSNLRKKRKLTKEQKPNRSIGNRFQVRSQFPILLIFLFLKRERERITRRLVMMMMMMNELSQ